MIGLLFLFAGAASYYDIRSRALAEALHELDHANRQVAELQEARFDRLHGAHLRATELLLAEISATPAADRAATFDALFPRAADGSRRSTDALFDGGPTPFGYVRGVGAFIGREPDAERRQLLTAATRVAHAIGEGIQPSLPSLYFFTRDNTLIMFAPDRADRLMFYRKQAPANLDFQQEPFAQISTPAVNPRRGTRCTPLVHILYDRTGKTWTTGCMTPVDINGRHVGTWGTSLLLDDLLSARELNSSPNADVVLISAEGMLIRHPDYTRQERAGEEKLLDLTKTRDPRLRALWSFVRDHQSGSFIGHAPELGANVAIRRLATPRWYVLTIQDEAVVSTSAVRAVQRVAITAIIGMVLQASLIIFILRRHVGRPLRRLAERSRLLARQFRREEDAPASDRHCPDEVEQLTHDFDVMAARLTAAHETLERQVAQRTDQLRAANAELTRIADLDPLTGIANRRRMIRDVHERLATRDPGAIYMLLLDIDHFKRVNDTYGHLAGDRLLVKVATAARALLRSGDLLGRIGGEEFMALIEATSRTEALTVAERLRIGLGQLSPSDEMSDPARISVSIGIVGAHSSASFTSLYAAADVALYAAKAGGRNQCCLADEQPHGAGQPARAA